MRNVNFMLKLGHRAYLSKNKKAFTFVEMMIVVVIITILATIAFLTLGNYTTDANKAKRVSDKNNIEKVLEMYKAKTWEYPTFDIEDEKQVFWPKAWEKVKQRIPELPVDPFTKKYYKIWYISAWKNWQIAFVDLDLEKEKIVKKMNESYTPKYEDKSWEPSETIISEVIEENSKQIPTWTRYKLLNWEWFIINENTWRVTFVIIPNANPWDIISATIRVVYPDLSIDEIPFNVTVWNGAKEDYIPKYEDSTSKPWAKVEIPVNKYSFKVIP